MMRSRLVMAVTVVAAVTVGAVGGALIGVPGLSGAQPFPPRARPPRRRTRPTPGRRPWVEPGCSTRRPRRSTSRPQHLLDKLSDGKTTIADVAKQQNVDVNTVIDAMASGRQGPHRRHREQAVARSATSAATRRPGRSGLRPGCAAASAGFGGIVARPGRQGARHHDRRAEDRSRQRSVDRRHREGEERRRRTRSSTRSSPTRTRRSTRR